MKFHATAPGARYGWRAAMAVMIFAAALVPATSAGAEPPAVTRFPVPGSAPVAITAGHDGALWFAQSESRMIGRITTAGDITQYPLPARQSFVESVGEIAAGSDGALWLADCDTIRRFDPADGSWAAFPVPAAYPDPANTCARAITAGPDGNIWFTSLFDDVNGTTAGGLVGRITLTPDHAITQFAPLPGSLEPETITTGPDGALWFTEGGSGIGRLSTDGSITSFPLPQPPQDAGCPRSITAGSDGALWFPLVCEGTIGRLTTAGSFTQFPTSDPLSSAYGIAAGPDGAVWYGLTDGSVGRMTPDGTASVVPVPDTMGQGAATGIVAGPDGAMWFTGLGTTPPPGPPRPGPASTTSTTASAPPPPDSPPGGTTATTGPPHSSGFIGRASVPTTNGTSETVAPGGTASTNSTSSPGDPVGTSVTVPQGGSVSIQESPQTDVAPAGFRLLGQQVEITAPLASIDAPLLVEFRLDASLIPAAGPDSVAVFRDGEPIAPCTGAGPSADPDPCVDSRASLPDGDLRIRIRTSHASDWGLGEKIDSTAPTVTCGSADGQWHAANVDIACTATDDLSGLSPANAAFSLSTGVAPGTESAAAATGTRSVCDKAGNCTVAGPVTGNRIDRQPPSITLRVPADDARYELLSGHTVDYACTDAGSAVASCRATQADGSRLPTGLSALGSHTFTVTATDRVGNTTHVTHDYRVGIFLFPTR